MKTSFSEALVLKRVTYGESDRIITLLVPDRGKIACMAKGVRKLASTKKSSLELGMHCKVQLQDSKGMPLITQASIVYEFSGLRQSLPKTKQLFQVLEVIDRLVEDANEEVFTMCLDMLHGLEDGEHVQWAVEQLNLLLQKLGYQPLEETSFYNITEYVEYLSEQKMKSYAFLSLK